MPTRITMPTLCSSVSQTWSNVITIQDNHNTTHGQYDEFIASFVITMQE